MKMEEVYVKKILTVTILLALAALAFFLLKPILLSIILGIFLAFIFMPLYNKLQKLIKLKGLSAIIICVLLLGLVLLPFYFLIPIFVDQAVGIYSSSQQIDFTTIVKNIFPSVISTDKFSEELGSMFYTLVTRITNSIIAYLSQLILNAPKMLLQWVIILFTFYFVLINKKEFFVYVQSLLPFSKEIEKKIINQTKMVTSSVIYGQVIIGIIQGIIAGIGLMIFKVPNALLLTVVMCIAGILPIIGTVIIWVPIAIFLLIDGNAGAALGVVIFGFISSIVDNFLRPIIVARRAKIHPAILLAGMVGGLYAFGVLGFILGPLILAYLLILLEVYQGKKIKASPLQLETS